MTEDGVDTTKPPQVAKYVRMALMGDRFLARKVKILKSGEVVSPLVTVIRHNSLPYPETYWVLRGDNAHSDICIGPHETDPRSERRNTEGLDEGIPPHECYGLVCMCCESPLFSHLPSFTLTPLTG